MPTSHFQRGSPPPLREGPYPRSHTYRSLPPRVSFSLAMPPVCCFSRLPYQKGPSARDHGWLSSPAASLSFRGEMSFPYVNICGLSLHHGVRDTNASTNTNGFSSSCADIFTIHGFMSLCASARCPSKSIVFARLHSMEHQGHSTPAFDACHRVLSTY